MGGTDRYETAVKTAEADRGTTAGQVRGEADNVVIASGENYADALSASYLAATKDAPILVSKKGSLPQSDIEFLKNYGAKNIFIVGGKGAVDTAVEDQLKGLQSYDVQAKQQTQQVQSTIHRGNINSDTSGVTLSAPITYDNQAAAPAQPVLSLTYSAGPGPLTTIDLDAATKTAGWTVSNPNVGAGTATLTAPASLGGGSATVTVPTNGSTGNVTLKVNDAAATVTTTQPVPGGATDRTATGSDRMIVPLNTKLQVTRIGGSNRFQTNRLVNQYAGATSLNPVGSMVSQYGQASKKTAILVNGLTPWDALAAGPLVGNGGRGAVPLVLTAGDKLVDDAKAQFTTMDIANALVIGGESAIPSSVANQLNGSNVTTTRLAGSNRFATAKAIGEFALRSGVPSATNTTPGLSFGTHSPILANGGMTSNTVKDDTKWADALTAGAWAARQNRVIALATTADLPKDTQDFLSANKASFTPVTAVGLGGAISTAVVNAANALVAR
nr:cell wall-binding repeat-containing protein [Dermatophilus congolensis]